MTGFLVNSSLENFTISADINPGSNTVEQKYYLFLRNWPIIHDLVTDFTAHFGSHQQLVLYFTNLQGF